MSLNVRTKLVVQKMRDANLSEALQNTFLRAIELTQGGDAGLIPEAQIDPVQSLPNINELEDSSSTGVAALPKTVVLKLNGGLGTSMGLAQAKSLLPVRDGLCFLDVIAQQVIHLRRQHRSDLPLIFMNSFRTEADTLAKLEEILGLAEGQANLPFSFLQHKVPKLRAADFSPVDHENDSDLEWCPPGHGDIYLALDQSGILNQLLTAGYEYAFVSNADNLGASLDVDLLGYFAANDIPFLMEVADRTNADKKGGHVAQYADSAQLLLREVAQTPPDDLPEFQNIERHKFFNTNSIWLNLRALKTVLKQNSGVIPLPIIINRKTVDPADKSSEPVIQIESAMGAAIEVFAGSQAIRVSRNRFRPVKKTNDLLILMSDLFDMDTRCQIIQSNESPLPDIQLDEQFFSNIDDYLARIPFGPPSLKACSSLTVNGDVYFGKHVQIIGDVTINAPDSGVLKIDDNTVLSG
ncbi:MAG: UTP--glucose-1-phosphate uridylyltransferase [Pseudomonadota bacterium]